MWQVSVLNYSVCLNSFAHDNGCCDYLLVRKPHLTNKQRNNIFSALFPLKTKASKRFIDCTQQTKGIQIAHLDQITQIWVEENKKMSDSVGMYSHR